MRVHHTEEKIEGLTQALPLVKCQGVRGIRTQSADPHSNHHATDSPHHPKPGAAFTGAMFTDQGIQLTELLQPTGCLCAEQNTETKQTEAAAHWPPPTSDVSTVRGEEPGLGAGEARASTGRPAPCDKEQGQTGLTRAHAGSPGDPRLHREAAGQQRGCPASGIGWPGC